MLKQIKGFILDESGVETVEWAIVGGVVVALAVGFFTVIGGQASVGFASLKTSTAVATTVSMLPDMRVVARNQPEPCNHSCGRVGTDRIRR